MFSDFLQLLGGPIPKSAQTSLSALIKDQYGMDITPVDTESDFENQGYHKLPSNLFARYSSILQQVPSLLAANVSNPTYCDAFIVSIPSGLGDSAKLMQKSNGVLSGTIVNSNTGKIIGQADLAPIEKVASAAPNIALAAFSIASIATGQYFMARIDNRLSGIEKTVNSIQKFLELDKRSELSAQQQFLLETQHNLEAIISCDIQRQATLTNVQVSRQKALSAIFFYHAQIEAVQMDLSVLDDKKKAVDVLDHVVGNLPEYWSAVHLYGLSTLVELLLSQNLDHSYLENMQQDLSKRHNDYKNYYNACINNMAKYIKTAKGFQVNAFPYTAAKALGLSLSLISWPTSVIGTSIISGSKNALKVANEMRRTQTLTDFSKQISIYGDTSKMETVSDSIALLDEMYHGAIELACKGDNIYIKLPDKS